MLALLALGISVVAVLDYEFRDCLAVERRSTVHVGSAFRPSLVSNAPFLFAPYSPTFFYIFLFFLHYWCFGAVNLCCLRIIS
jgi:hypothetical protein